MAGNRESYLKFRRQLSDIAPLPWRLTGDGKYIEDANGTVILAGMLNDEDARCIVAGGVLCGVFTCGGFQLVANEDHIQFAMAMFNFYHQYGLTLDP